MGLDLYLTKKSDFEANNFSEEAELTYGRKTWMIANFFASHPTRKIVEKECVYEITKESYMELCARALPYKDYLKAINETGFENELSDNTAEYIIGKVFADDDEQPQLGYTWEASALYNWCFTDHDKVMKAFDEEPVYMVMSY